jgi:hypothetical protein
MPRFTLCAAIPLFDREPINPAVPINRLRAPRGSGRPGVLRPARYRVPCTCGHKPDGISRSSERHFDCCWSER